MQICQRHESDAYSLALELYGRLALHLRKLTGVVAAAARRDGLRILQHTSAAAAAIGSRMGSRSTQYARLAAARLAADLDALRADEDLSPADHAFLMQRLAIYESAIDIEPQAQATTPSRSRPAKTNPQQPRSGSDSAARPSDELGTNEDGSETEHSRPNPEWPTRELLEHLEAMRSGGSGAHP